MSETRRFSRRSVLEGIGIGTLGLAGAALLGCGGDGDGEIGAGAGGAAQVVGGAAGGAETLPMVAPVNKGTPKKGGSFKRPNTSTFTELDAHTTRGPNEWHLISERLMNADLVTGETVPNVATSWETPDPKGTTIVLKIRPGMKIHNKPPWNGREFDAVDVAWNLERARGLYAERLNIPAVNFQRASFLEYLTKAEAVDKLTVKVTLSQANSGFFSSQTETRHYLQPKEMDDVGFTDPMKFGSIGAFMEAEKKKDQIQRFTKHPEYFVQGEPMLDETMYLTIPDRGSQIAAFTSGQLDILTGVAGEEVQQLRTLSPDHLLYTAFAAGYSQWRPSMSYAPFKDFRVRHALHLATDYQAMGDTIYGSGWGMQAVLCPAYPEGWKPKKIASMPGYNPATKAADRAEANRLMSAAGYANGKGIAFHNMIGNTASVHVDAATILQAQWKTVFPEANTTLRPLDSANLNNQQNLGQFDSLTGPISPIPDAAAELNNFHRTGASRNYGRFSEPALDALVDKAMGELNRDARTQILEDIQTRWFNEWRSTQPLFDYANAVAVGGHVGGFEKTWGPWFQHGLFERRWWFKA